MILQKIKKSKKETELPPISKRKLKRKRIAEEAELKPHITKKYKRQKCDFIDSNGKRCSNNAVGKGTLCKKHGGNPIVKENLVPALIEKKSLISVTKYKPETHPIEFIDFSRRGMSEVEIAAEFQVSVRAIKRWAEKFESFSIAYEIGQAMHEAWWINQGKNNLNARDFNTNLFKFLTSNKLGYSDKMETKSTNLNIHGVLLAPDVVTEDEWEQENSEDIIDVDS